ncbi:MAG: hypothetical protein JSW58_03785 [Candidatus Latescibacterota bacterium]|nr:MAG: hypothetical protein JSW58_03785 [Candidatus Latescibacterota bacterium]
MKVFYCCISVAAHGVDEMTTFTELEIYLEGDACIEVETTHYVEDVVLEEAA